MKAQELLNNLYKNNELETKIKGLKKVETLKKTFNCCAQCDQTLNFDYAPGAESGTIQEILSCHACDPVGVTRTYRLQ